MQGLEPYPMQMLLASYKVMQIEDEENRVIDCYYDCEISVHIVSVYVEDRGQWELLFFELSTHL